MYRNFKYSVIFLYSSIFLLTSCSGQEVTIPNTTPVIYKTKKEYLNLKGDIKEIRGWIYNNYEKDSTMSKWDDKYTPNLIMENLGGYWRFYNWGGGNSKRRAFRFH